MPHTTFKERSHPFNLEAGKCPCGQTFYFTSERDRDMKLQLHRKFCPKLPESSKHVRTAKKAMILREQQHYETERKRMI